jgi:hypothetical protein
MAFVILDGIYSLRSTVGSSEKYQVCDSVIPSREGRKPKKPQCIIMENRGKFPTCLISYKCKRLNCLEDEGYNLDPTFHCLVTISEEKDFRRWRDIILHNVFI